MSKLSVALLMGVSLLDLPAVAQNARRAPYYKAYAFYPAIVAPNINGDLKAPDRYSVYLNQSGLGLPDRDYYLKPEFAAQREAYAAYATQLLTLLGWSDPAGAASGAIAFESAIAEDGWDKTKLRDPTIQYN